MPIHKLAMGPIALNVVAAEQTEGQFGTQVLFTAYVLKPEGQGDWTATWPEDLGGAQYWLQVT